MKLAKKLVLVAAVLPLTFATASAFAYGGKGGHHGKGGDGQCGGFDRKVFSQLDLTDAQKEQMKEMRQSMKSEMKAKRGENVGSKTAEMQARHQKMQDVVLADTFDAAAANELASEMVAKQTERRVKMMEKQHEMLSILTPEQKTKLKEVQQERMQKCVSKMESKAAK
ncbi:CpxP family protein [Vibrio methylphosphonaticus]|uniref:CpxP family protein n=1 Tax=Vibrio methylphosphonaticus TaxID=2946866 RepID=UPI00202A0A2B|nr:CpxP family protein [Vibrio methylphosphonaticus]MCL9776399.1 CpxP family protein [Vibrio methylphosphonaticus]